jgi:hypothetical protein
MLEAVLVFSALGSVGLILLLAMLLTPPVLVMLAIGIMVLGLVVGVPTGLWYHVVLYRLVAAKAPVPRRWWVSPAALHVHLTDAEERSIRLWYRLGGIGFVLSMVGGLGAIAVLLILR